MELIPCEICSENNEQEFSTKGRDGKYLRTVICRQCGLVYTNPRPLPSNIEEYYQHSYRLDYKGAYQPKRKHVLRAAKVAISRIKKIQKYLFRGMKALDIGSGGGEVVYAMRPNGVDCYGLDPNEGYALYAKNVLGLPISIGCIETAKLPENFYDIITMYHVIEHLYSPFRALCNIYSCLKPEGLLVMECPNIEARCQTPSNRLHRAHLYNFNEITLIALAEKAGFEIIKMSLSSDGGNIHAIFRKKKNAVLLTDLSQNYYRVLRAWESHTNLRHLLSHRPYSRVFKKGIRILHENLAALSVNDGLTLLKKTFAESYPQVCDGIQKKFFLPKHKILAGSLAGIIFLIFSFWTTHSLLDHSDEIMRLAARHQDGNDLFAVLKHKRLKNIKPTKEVIVLKTKDDLYRMLSSSDIRNLDIHLIVEDDHLEHVHELIRNISMKTIQVITLGNSNYHIFTTEAHYGNKI